jgi:radical SAM protein with 4Fe4S-binding SPASM domain
MRTDLSEVLPLATPFSLHVFPSYYCNFRCTYCLHSLSAEALRERRFERRLMFFGTYKKAIDGLKEFPDKLKAIIFAGHGEPLFHPQISAMVKYADGIADRTEIVTNGSLLSMEMSEGLVSAGLGVLRVSIQAVTDEGYERVTGRKVNVADLIGCLRYFYNMRGNTRVHVKIIDMGLSKDDIKRFYDLFGPVADEVSVEYVIPFINEIPLTNDQGKTKHGGQESESKICSMPFYMIALEPNGDLVPCCSSVVPCCYGNVKKESIKQMWDSQERNQFLLLQLVDLSQNRVCGACSVPRYGLQEGDYLDEDRGRLIKVYGEESCPS